jgi:hypothetical protein
VTLSLSATPLSTQNPTKRSGKERGEVSSTPFLYTTCFTCIYLHTNGNGVPARKPPLHSFGAPPDRRRVLASCVPESCFGRSWVGPASAESESEKRKTAIQARGNSFSSATQGQLFRKNARCNTRLWTLGGSYRSDLGRWGARSVTFRVARQVGGQSRQMGGCSCILPVFCPGTAL